MNLPIENSLVLSTGHIKESTCRKLEKGLTENGNGIPFRTVGHLYGVIIFLILEIDEVDLEEETDLLKKADMEELIPVLKLARENDCSTINFDRDASLIDILEQFNW